MLVHEMHEHGVDIWGDGSTYKGNDIERFFRYGLLANPALRIYKPWLDPVFVEELGGRAELSEWLAERGLPYHQSKEKAYSTDANIWGATHEAKELELLGHSMHIVEPIMGVRHWDPSVDVEPERVVVDVPRGLAGGAQRRRPTTTGSRSCSRRTRSAGGTGSGCPTRSRTGSSSRRAAASTRRPGMALLHVAYERLVNAIHNEATIDNYRTMGRRLGRLLYEGRWFDPQALMLRQSLQHWVGATVSGDGDARAASRGRLHDPRHGQRERDVPPRAALDGARRGRGLRAARPDRAADDARQLDIEDSRDKLGLYARLGLTAASDPFGILGTGDDEPV